MRAEDSGESGCLRPPRAPAAETTRLCLVGGPRGAPPTRLVWGIWGSGLGLGSGLAAALAEQPALGGSCLVWGW